MTIYLIIYIKVWKLSAYVASYTKQVSVHMKCMWLKAAVHTAMPEVPACHLLQPLQKGHIHVTFALQYRPF